MKKLLFYLLLCCYYASYGQLTCPSLISPMDADADVSVNTAITWSLVAGAQGYIISIGTSPNSTEIVNERAVGDANTYQPPLGLPEESAIYVTITPLFANQTDLVCSTEMFRTENVTEPPSCTSLKFPVNKSKNVNVGTSIEWDYAPTATAYRLSVGTSPGGTDLLDNENIVGSLTYQPPVDLPFNSEIFVTLIPYNENGPAPLLCPWYSFTTSTFATIPNCTSLTSPVDGAVNVELSTALEWVAVPNAVGYRVTIGTTSFNANVLRNVNFTKNKTLVIAFEPNLTFFATITPYNSAGEALDCKQESFATILGCGPVFDSTNNQLVDLRPKIDFPDLVAFCKNEIPLMVASEDIAEGFRWYKIDEFNNEELISNEPVAALAQTGRYRYEAYNTASQSGNTIECDTSKIFEVVSSENATIDNLNVTRQSETIDVTVDASGNGDYEFAVDNSDGPYQDSSNFKNLELGFHTFYVRDKNGCGIVEKTLEQNLTLDGFPKFFTPNGDGINDFWQFIPPLEITDMLEVLTGSISIFDRYGNLLLELDPKSEGWNGNFNGKPLPASDYWFRAVSTNQQKIIGHFSLKR